MNQAAIIERTKSYVRETLEGEGTGHDWWHIQRVLNNAVLIGEKEGADMLVVQLGALLHDIADFKFHGGDETVGPRVAKEWLEQLHVTPSIIERVVHIVKDISFKGANVATPMQTLEGKVVQDADRLDALGAIGIARTFAYGGYRGNELHNPEQAPVMHDTFEAYKNSNGTTINHFYEKLLLLKELMNTSTGKALAEERHRYMEEFLTQFYREWGD